MILQNEEVIIHTCLSDKEIHLFKLAGYDLNKNNPLNFHPYLWQDADCFDIPERNHENTRGCKTGG